MWYISNFNNIKSEDINFYKIDFTIIIYRQIYNFKLGHRNNFQVVIKNLKLKIPFKQVSHLKGIVILNHSNNC